MRRLTIGVGRFCNGEARFPTAECCVMRILIFSDLHANWQALLSLQSAEKPPDAILFAGDAVGYGPDAAACVAWLRNNVTAAIQGDHDRAVATGTEYASPDEWRDLARATRDVTRALLHQNALDYLAALPPEREVELGGARFWLTHQPPLAYEQIRADIILCGHTHIPALRRVNAKWIVNPGSLGQPRHGLPSATYAVWEDGGLKIQHIDYDPAPTIQRLALLPLDPDHLSRLQEALATGI